MSQQYQHRNIRRDPDPEEPSFSYEEKLFLQQADNVEDVFHRRLAAGSRHSGSHAAHAAEDTAAAAAGGESAPAFSSVNIRGSGGKRSARGSSLLSAAMEQEDGGKKRAPTSNGKQKVNETKSAVAPIPSRASIEGSRRDSSTSNNSSFRDDKRRKEKERASDRRLKIEAQASDIDIGHIVDSTDAQQEVEAAAMSSMPTFTNMPRNESKDLGRSSSDQSTGSLLYCKTPSTGNSTISPFGSGGMMLNAGLGKSSSLIFPTGVDAKEEGNNRETVESARRKLRLVGERLNQCEATTRFFKKKLILDNLDLTALDIPLKDLCGTALGISLHKLSLRGNRLGSIPAKLVQSLPVLKQLDLQHCELHQLPDQWNLPKLARLNLSHNRLTDFPEEGMLEGLPELQDLNMYWNKVPEICLPPNPKLLQKLETLNMGFNDLVWLPDNMDQLKALKTLRVQNNCLQRIPMRVCDMDLKTIDVTSNPVTEPPIETCERGICAMRRHWQCLRMEEQSKKKASAELQKKVTTKQQKGKMGQRLKSFINMGASSGPSPSILRKSASAGTPSEPIASNNLHALSSSLRSSSSSATTMHHKLALLERTPKVPELTEAPKSAPAQSRVAEEAPGVTLDDVVLVPKQLDDVSVNDTLKVIFVGMAMVGKTSMIKRLIEGKDAKVPNRDERTVGVDIYDWEPKNDKRFEHIDSRIEFQDEKLRNACGDVDVKFSVWDFAGQHVYHATHELFFSSRALYVLVWDMGATNEETARKKTSGSTGETGAFKLYDSSDEEDESEDEADVAVEEEERRADRALERDIDEKVQFWVDCIQSTSPGAAILPVASFNDHFVEGVGGEAEAKRRCNMLKQRLLKHEARRIEGIKERLKAMDDEKSSDDIAASRLRTLLCPYTRPKLIFGDDENSVVRVSGTRYTGFGNLTEQIINIATGKDKRQWKFPIFHGHVGVRIPRMRFQVREAVRAMRGRFKVVEWGYFINVLREQGLTNVEDISDALHFLTNTGELSYFGGVDVGSKQTANPLKGTDASACENMRKEEVLKRSQSSSMVSRDSDDEDDDLDEEWLQLSMESTSITAPSTEDGSLTTVEDYMSSGLSQFVFLNPRWLVAAVACVLRHDLDREIKETRRLVASGSKNPPLSRTASFYDAHLNCPVITADDASMLWQHKRITKKAAERAQEYSNNLEVTPFEFLQMLLVRFGVFVPIDLSIDKVLFGGREYQHLVEDLQSPDAPGPITPLVVDCGEQPAANSKFFFLPSLLGPSEPSEVWTYKSTDAWKTTLCHSILFPDGVPTGLMERLTSKVLSAMYVVSHREGPSAMGPNGASYEGRLAVKEVLCWRTAFYIKIGAQVEQPDGTLKESVVEVFTHLVGRESHMCVGSNFMGVGMRRLVTSGRGQVGDGGRKIWKGGYLLVVKSIQRVMSEYGGVEFEKQAICPDCLAKKSLSEASAWGLATIRSAVMNSAGTLRCHYGHRVDARLVTGPSDSKKAAPVDLDGGVPVQDLLGAVVVVGLWDGRSRKIVRVGSGFIVDKKRGLIVTAAHTLMNIWGDKNFKFGENYYGLDRGKVVVGIIPHDKDGKDIAVFRYFAQIVAKDPGLDDKECHVDACVLRITTRMESDVGGNGDGCGDQAETLLLNNKKALLNEKLPTLKITDNCELEEQVRILGYNQGGTGLLGPGEQLNRFVDFAKGYVCMKFVHEEETGSNNKDRKERFKPREEIVAICPTIGGHSGGPCVNLQGEIVGILSRADPAEKQRCYLVPGSELKALVSRAKKQL